MAQLVARGLGRSSVALLLAVTTLLGRVATLLLMGSAISTLLRGVTTLLLAVTALLRRRSTVAWGSTAGRGELSLATVATLLRRGTVAGDAATLTVGLLVLGVV